MRFALCSVLLSVCIVALQCTANANDGPDILQKVEDSEGAVVATTTTTAAQQKVALGSTPEDSGRERTTEGDEQTEHQTEEARARAAAAAAAAAQPAAKPITTTTAANVVPELVEDTLSGAEKLAKNAVDPKHEIDASEKVGQAQRTPDVVERAPEAAPVLAEAAAPQTTTTTTVSVKSLPVPDNSQTKVQTPPTTTVVQTHSSPPSTPEREVAPGGPEPGKKNAGAPAKTPGDKTISQERGAHASVPAVKDAAVTPPTSIATNNNGYNAGVQPNKNSRDKETHQKQTPNATSTTTEEQQTSTETSTTSSATPAKETSPGIPSTLPKGFKIPQSVDKTDDISSVSLWFAFATLFMFAVTAVTPVH